MTFHNKSLGKKSLTFPCDEDIFLSVFKDNTRRYSPARRFYLYSFVGEEGDEQLRNLLDDKGLISFISFILI
jgi:hypothetical protein